MFIVHWQNTLTGSKLENGVVTSCVLITARRTLTLESYRPSTRRKQLIHQQRNCLRMRWCRHFDVQFRPKVINCWSPVASELVLKELPLTLELSLRTAFHILLTCCDGKVSQNDWFLLLTPTILVTEQFKQLWHTWFSLQSDRRALIAALCRSSRTTQWSYVRWCAFKKVKEFIEELMRYGRRARSDTTTTRIVTAEPVT